MFILPAGSSKSVCLISETVAIMRNCLLFMFLLCSGHVIQANNLTWGTGNMLKCGTENNVSWNDVLHLCLMTFSPTASNSNPSLKMNKSPTDTRTWYMSNCNNARMCYHTETRADITNVSTPLDVFAAVCKPVVDFQRCYPLQIRQLLSCNTHTDTHTQIISWYCFSSSFKHIQIHRWESIFKAM